MKATDFFDVKRTLAARLLVSAEYPWDALDMLAEYIYRVGKGLDRSVYKEVKKGIWIAGSAHVSESAVMKAPVIVGEGCEIGNHTSIGGAVIIDAGAVIGNGCEIKNAVIFEGARAPQHNYISDSFIGCGASLGAGAIISSLHSDRKEIVCTLGEKTLKCERKRLGAIIGDGAQIGCSSVLLAGTVVDRGASVGPLTRARGFVSAQKAYKGEKILSDIL